MMRVRWGLGVLALAFTTAVSLASSGCKSGDESGKAPGATASAGDADAGKQKFSTSCSTCHGENAAGVKGLGKSLRASAFVKGSPPETIVAMVEEGRAADHPENTTGVAMPPKGGNPGLTDEDVRDIAVYLKTLQ